MVRLVKQVICGLASILLVFLLTPVWGQHHDAKGATLKALVTKADGGWRDEWRGTPAADFSGFDIREPERETHLSSADIEQVQNEKKSFTLL